jgi:hypothetical protein
MSKYHATPTRVGNLKFASRLEAHRYQDLTLLEKAGEIAGLKTHPRFVLQEAFTDSSGTKHRAIVYEADFSYVDLRTGKEIIEEVKGYSLNRAWLLKKKMFLYRYRDVEFRITK